MLSLISNDAYTYAIALPARDEADRIVSCLEACRVAMQEVSTKGVIALVINNTSDQSAALAKDWAAYTRTPLELSDVKFPDDLAHAGSARRAAFDLARSLVCDCGFLLTTDADTIPSPQWIRESLDPLIAREAAMVCGSVQIDPHEARLLPEMIAARGEVEDRYQFIARELTNLMDPDPWNSWPFHGQESGASLAMTVEAYDRVGGLPIVRVAEDRALAQRFRERDLPIFYSARAEVLTSCRVMGRAPGGMACTILQRMVGGKHICDEALEPARKTHLRAQLRARVRRVFETTQDSRLALQEAGLPPDAQWPVLHYFGEVWAFVEAHHPRLQRRPMTWEQMYRQLPLLEALRDVARASATRSRMRDQVISKFGA